ncbi:RDD family protein [Actinotalea sp. AC32]|nr:RDD family protein [Actinotalea sp. AC32]
MTIDGGGSAITRAPDDVPGPGPLPPLPVPLEPPYASWGRRVAAALLDQVLLTGAAFLLFPVQPVEPPTWLGPVLNTGTREVAGVWTDSAAYVGLVAVMVIMQAYLGGTPGKLALGIAVLHDRDLRPVGVVRTVLRQVAHVVDALILFIGYLRPLWHRERRTFADSLAATVVVRTQAPLPWTWTRPTVVRAAVPVWERPSRPQWMQAVAWASTAACSVGLLFAYGPTSVRGSGGLSGMCVATETSPGGPDQGTIEVRYSPEQIERFGVVRRMVGSGPAGVEVVWQIDEILPSQATLRLRLEDRETGVTRTVDHAVVDNVVQPGRGTPLEDGRLGVVLPLTVLDGMNDWTWELTTVLDGVETPACTGW